MNFFEQVLEDPKGLEEKILGPQYNYIGNIKTPAQMGMSSKGSLSVLAKDIEGIIAYIEILASGGGNASKTGKPLGNRFFFKTNATCKDVNSDQTVDRYMYINNIPDGSIPFLSSAMGVNFSELKGLIPGTMSNISAINPLAIFQAFQMSGNPDCREITMETVDVNNVRSTETRHVADADISNLSACNFPNGKNPLTGSKCVMAFSNMKKPKMEMEEYNYSKIPDDPLVKLFYLSIGIMGVYILFEALKKANKKK
jgi:hypothetical protein